MSNKKIIKKETYDKTRGLYVIEVGAAAYAVKGDKFADRLQNAVKDFLKATEEKLIDTPNNSGYAVAK